MTMVTFELVCKAMVAVLSVVSGLLAYLKIRKDINKNSLKKEEDKKCKIIVFQTVNNFYFGNETFELTTKEINLEEKKGYIQE